MPPSAQDAKLTGISLREAYAAISAWYLENLAVIDWRSGHSPLWSYLSLGGRR